MTDKRKSSGSNAGDTVKSGDRGSSLRRSLLSYRGSADSHCQRRTRCSDQVTGEVEKLGLPGLRPTLPTGSGTDL